MPQIRVGWRSGTIPLSLDTYMGSAAAFSLRKLKNSYSGSAIRVRRSLDNAEQNIGFDAQGNLDAAALLAFVNVADTSSTRLLDSYSNAAAAYSLRKLRSGYSGPAIRVRRSSDNAEQDISFDSSGNLDTAALLAFVGSGSGFVATWYDQSPNGRNVTQATAASQPRIANAGAADMLLGKPSLYFDGSDDCLDRTDTGMPTLGTTVAHVSKYTSTTVDQAFVVNWGSGSAGQAFYNMYYNNGIGLSNYGEAFNITGRLNANNLTIVTKPNATGYQSWKLYVNSTSTNALAMNSATTLLNSAGGFRIGRVNPSQGNTFAMLGYISEVVVWPSDLDSQRTLIESNINSYYSVYSATTNGFVTTWYDQSGSAKDATQTTAASQPQIVSSGATVLSNNRPSILFTGGRFLSTASVTRANANEAFSMYGVYRLLSTTRQSQFKWGNTEIEPGANANGVALTQFGGFSYSPNSSEYWSTSTALVSVVFTGGLISNTSIYYNGTYRASGFTNGGNGNLQTSGAITIGKGPYSNGNTAISELLFYPTGAQNANVNAINDNINAYYSIWDIDAEAFIAAAALGGSWAGAIRTLVPALKSAGLWAKCRAIYPFVGGTAAKQKLNLKDPRDLDAAYRLTFSGGWTYWNEGPQASYGTAQTYFNPTTVFGATSSASLGVYQAGGLNGSGHGAWSHSGTRRMAIFESGGGFIRSQITSAATEAVSPDMRGVTNGFIIANRSSSTSNKIWRHGVVQGSNTATETALLPDANITLCNVNGNASSGYVNATLYFAYIAEGLTDAQVSAMHSAVQAFRMSYGYYI